MLSKLVGSLSRHRRRSDGNITVGNNHHKSAKGKDTHSVTEPAKSEQEQKEHFKSAVSALTELRRLGHDKENGSAAAATLTPTDERVSSSSKSNVFNYFNKRLKGSLRRKKKHEQEGKASSEPAQSPGQAGQSSTIEEDSAKASTDSASARETKEQLPMPFLKHEDIFPNLNDTFLADNGLEGTQSSNSNSTVVDVPLKGSEFSEEELREKFLTLSLAFKTDWQTLSTRMSNHQRNREITEKNTQKEIACIRDTAKLLMSQCTDAQSRELCTKLQTHIEILEYAIIRMSSKAELHGAAQQELRLCRAVEVLLLHVENVHAAYKRERNEMQDMLKVLQDKKTFPDRSVSESDSSDNKPKRSSEVATSEQQVQPAEDSLGTNIAELPVKGSLPKLLENGMDVLRRRLSVAPANKSSQKLLRTSSVAQETSSVEPSIDKFVRRHSTEAASAAEKAKLTDADAKANSMLASTAEPTRRRKWGTAVTQVKFTDPKVLEEADVSIDEDTS